MNFILFNNPEWATELLPFTFTRPIAAIRCGIFTLAEKWENYLGHKVSHQADLKFRALYPLVEQDTNVIVDGNIIATPGLASVLLVLQPGEALVSGNLVIAVCHTGSLRHPDLNSYAKNSRPVEYEGGKVERLRHTCDIFAMVGNQIRADFRWIKDNFRNGKISDPYTVVYNPDNVFIEEGAKLTAAVLNATEGPIYIGKNAEVQEGAVIRGPFALGEGSVVNMGAKIRQDTAIGPYCKVGGEISNSVLMGYSNKGHDGFLGNSVLGEWCNLGADTNTSNLKNNYDNVKLWSYSERGFINTGRIFCGLMMGDHSKAGINTMFNTGTVVGVGCNIYGGGFPPKYVPSFSWGGADSEFVPYRLEQLIATENRVMGRRGKSISRDYEMLLGALYIDEATAMDLTDAVTVSAARKKARADKELKIITDAEIVTGDFEADNQNDPDTRAKE